MVLVNESENRHAQSRRTERRVGIPKLVRAAKIEDVDTRAMERQTLNSGCSRYQ